MELPLSMSEASVPRETAGTMPLELGACQRSQRLLGWHAGAGRLSAGGKLLRSTTMHLPVLSYLVAAVAPRTPVLCVLNAVRPLGSSEGQGARCWPTSASRSPPRALGQRAPPCQCAASLRRRHPSSSTSRIDRESHADSASARRRSRAQL